MTKLRIGDQIRYQERAYEVRGVSPVSVTPPTVYLCDDETGERIEVPFDELDEPAIARPSRAQASGQLTG